MRILLLDSPISSDKKFGKQVLFGSNSPPYNILVLGTILKHRGHEVRLMDSDTAMDALRTELEGWKPALVGVSFMSLGVAALPHVDSLIAQVAPGATFIAGGYHASLFPEEAFELAPNLKAVFLGEAEVSLPLFVASLATGLMTEEVLSAIPGICYRAGDGSMKRTSPVSLVEDLDQLPFPDFSLLSDYFHRYYSSINTHYLGFPQAFLMTSRGCPFHCRFCGRKILGQKVRVHGNQYILELIDRCVQEHNIRSIIFGDEFLTAKREKSMEFLEALAARNYKGLRWRCSGRVNNIDMELARAMYAAGCRQICLGIESGSDTILRILDKRATVEQNAHAVKVLHEAGLETYGSLILGSPGETEETLRETMDFVLRYPLTYIGACYFSPMPGSHFYDNMDELRERGTIMQGDLNACNGFDELPFVPHDLTADRLREFRAELYRAFYFRFGRVVHEMKYAINPNSWRRFFRILWGMVRPAKEAD